MAEMKAESEKNKAEGEKFLAENAKKPGVMSTNISVNGPNGPTTAVLQYKILKEGNGPKPKATDTVTTQYRGRLINGKEFDSSYKRGQPAQFAVTGVIKGWTEALQMMPVGSKWELYLPSELAYGDHGAGADIPPGATLIFEIELVGIKEPPAPAQTSKPAAQAVSGEIIKVPSAEELKKGAKIEVIHPDQTNTAAKPKK
jgi:FKBP-type peptidyl-prolyl cis-trans isomerase FklB